MSAAMHDHYAGYVIPAWLCQCLFAALKLNGIVHWHWNNVLWPTWIIAAICFLFYLFGDDE